MIQTTEELNNFEELILMFMMIRKKKFLEQLCEDFSSGSNEYDSD